jgi:ABC-type branched-subunit amino acid transport system permease subunit
MRACAINRDAARIVGIDTRLMVTISFVLAAMLGRSCGLAVTPLTQTAFNVGPSVGIKGFAAAILGGLGNPIAAVVGGIVLGMLESLSIAFISSTYKDAIALVVLLGVLFLRPQGILGSPVGRRCEVVSPGRTRHDRGWTGRARCDRVLRVPLLTSDRYLLRVLTFVGVNVIIVTGMALLFGYAGQVSLGHAAFYGIGAYGSAYVVVNLELAVAGRRRDCGRPDRARRPAAGASELAPAWALPRDGDARFGEIMRVFFVEARPVTGGPDGRSGIPVPVDRGFTVDTAGGNYWLVWGTAIVTLALAANLVRSRPDARCRRCTVPNPAHSRAVSTSPG